MATLAFCPAQILGNSQKYIKGKKGCSDDKPVFFVFHGGSGSSREEIREAISYGVVKMNIDTDTQVRLWTGQGPRGRNAKCNFWCGACGRTARQGYMYGRAGCWLSA